MAIEIRIVLDEASREAEVLLNQLNLDSAPIRLREFTKTNGPVYEVKDREAIKALVDTLEVGRHGKPVRVIDESKKA